MTLGWNMTTVIQIVFAAFVCSVLTEVLGVIVQFCVSYHFFTMAQQPQVSQGLLVVDASQSHSDKPHSVVLLWKSDQPHAETST